MCDQGESLRGFEVRVCVELVLACQNSQAYANTIALTLARTIVQLCLTYRF